MGIDGVVDTGAAARLLGVSSRRVGQLAEAGHIVRASRGLYDRLSIEAYVVTRRGTTDRAWDQATAWAAVAILSGRDAGWLNERSTYRLEATLRGTTAAGLVAKARDRARVRVYAGHPSAVRALHAEVVTRERSVLGLAGGTGEDVDGYVAGDRLAVLLDRFALVGSTSGSVTLRATDTDLGTVRDLADAGDVLVALDAAGSTDARTRGAGERALDEALARFREGR